MDKLPEENREPSEPAGDVPETQPMEVAETSTPPEPTDELAAEPAPEPAPEPERHHRTSEEALAEMRQVLREEETVEKTGFAAGLSRFFHRFARRKKPEVEEPVESPSRLDGIGIPASPAEPSTVSTEQAAPEAPPAFEVTPEPPEAAPGETTEGGQFRTLVRKKISGALPDLKMEPLVTTPELPVQEEALEFLAPLPTEAPEELHTGPTGQSILTGLRGEEEEVTEAPSELRQAALEDYVTEPEVPEEGGPSPLARRVRRSWRDMRPLDRRLLVGALTIVFLAFIGSSGYLVFQSLPTPTPVVTPTTSVLPVPVSLSLPGGWVFPLRTGIVGPDGVWNPTGPEWLRDTEICRWVSLPYTVQLEAVLRTLKADDQIQLSMSNYDSVIYKVRSIQKVSSSEIQQLAPKTPCLLVILTNKGSDDRWVVTAVP